MTVELHVQVNEVEVSTESCSNGRCCSLNNVGFQHHARKGSPANCFLTKNMEFQTNDHDTRITKNTEPRIIPIIIAIIMMMILIMQS